MWLLATISRFATWETIRCGVVLILFGLLPSEENLVSIRLVCIYYVGVFFAQDKYRYVWNRETRQPMFTFLYSPTTCMCINLCNIARYFDFFSIFGYRFYVCVLSNLQLHKHSKGNGLVIGNVYISFQCVTLWWHLPFDWSNNAYKSLDIYLSVSYFWFLFFPSYPFVFIYIYLSIYLPIRIYTQTHAFKHVRTSLSHFDSFSNVNTIWHRQCRNSPVFVSSSKHRQK